MHQHRSGTELKRRDYDKYYVYLQSHEALNALAIKSGYNCVKQYGEYLLLKPKLAVITKKDTHNPDS